MHSAKVFSLFLTGIIGVSAARKEVLHRSYGDVHLISEQPTEWGMLRTYGNVTNERSILTSDEPCRPNTDSNVQCRGHQSAEPHMCVGLTHMLSNPPYGDKYVDRNPICLEHDDTDESCCIEFAPGHLKEMSWLSVMPHFKTLMQECNDADREKGISGRIGNVNLAHNQGNGPTCGAICLGDRDADCKQFDED